jgi:hypothetical protein
MKRVGIFLLLARCDRRGITSGNKGNWPRKRDRWRHEASAATKAKRAARPGPNRGARRRAAREAEEKCRRPAAKLPHWPRKSPQMGLSGGGNHAKAEAQATTLTPLAGGWVA